MGKTWIRLKIVCSICPLSSVVYVCMIRICKVCSSTIFSLHAAATLSARATQCTLDAKYHADIEKLSLQLQQISNDSSAQVHVVVMLQFMSEHAYP